MKTKVIIFRAGKNHLLYQIQQLQDIQSRQNRHKLKEVINMYDTDHKTIKELFYKQILNMTKETNNLKSSSFDYQFSDRWVNECRKPPALDW